MDHSRANDNAYRIDLNNYQPDASKGQDLRRRLYDSGISNIPMPSVKRPIEEKISARPFSARMNSSKIQSLSPLKKRMQDLNTNIISNLNESYKEAAIQEAKYKGEGTAEYYRSQNIVIPQPTYNQPSAAGRKLQGRLGVSIGQARMTGQLLNQRKSGLEPEFRQKINDQLSKTGGMADPARIMAGPPSLVYAGFEGSSSMSQKNLEQARSKFLLDKMTGKLPAELRGGKARALPPIENQSQIEDESLNKTEKQADQISPIIDFGAQKNASKKPKQAQKWSDLDKYIELLLDSKSEEETVFTYLIPSTSGDPYDLQTTDFEGRKKEGITKYYTLSGNGLTTYENETPTEFLSLGQWLIERDSYNHIKELSFFKQFKQWKFMRMWKKTIKHQNRQKATNALEEKLFFLQDHFRDHLMTHRKFMLDMQQEVFVDTCFGDHAKKLKEFTEAQERKRKACEERIKSISEKSRSNIKECIEKVLDQQRKTIMSEIAADDERKKTNPINNNNTVTMKRKESDNVFDKLGFPAGMTYGHRSSLRKECSRFLRFAYLVDFLSLEALSKIYILSVSTLLDRISSLDERVDMPALMSMAFDETGGPGQANRNFQPLFFIDVNLNDKRAIDANEIVLEKIEDFLLPPRGMSKEEDFDLLSHLEIDTRVEKEGSESEEIDPEADTFVQKYKKTVPRIQNFWIDLTPTKEDFINAIDNTFKQGLTQIQVFTRWSRHGDMQDYANALEEWDDIVGDTWEEPESLELDPNTWIADNPIFKNKLDRTREIVEAGYEKAQQFLQRFQPILEIYWRNQQFEKEMWKLTDEKLLNAVDSLQNTLKLFKFYQTHFQSQLPRATDIGLLHLNSNMIKDKLHPTPKKIQDEIERIVPEKNKERTKEAKKWLNQSIKNLNRPVNDVEEFVTQTGFLNDVSEKIQGFRDRVELYGQFYLVLTEHGNTKIKKEDTDNHREATTKISQLTNLVQLVENTQDQQNEKFRKQLDSHIPVLNNEIDTLIIECDDPSYLDKNSDIDKMIEELSAKKERFEELEDRSKRYNTWQESLGCGITQFENIEKLREELINRHLMWKSLKEWRNLTVEWAQAKFYSIEAEKIQKTSETYAKIANRLEKSLPPNAIQEELKDLVEKFKQAMPIVVALRNVNLMPTHWDQIKNLINAEIDIKNNEDFTLQNLLDLNVVPFQEDICAISVRATGENKLSADIKMIEEMYKTIKIETKLYKDDREGVFVLTAVDEVYAILDEQQANINQVLGNRFVSIHRQKAEELRKLLQILERALEKWIEVQRLWIYLENIMSGKEIKKELQKEHQAFENVDKQFKKKMQATNKANLWWKGTSNDESFVKKLEQWCDTLEEISKSLDNYLGQKRKLFPRFYFLSNEELLHILANSENKDAVCSHLKTLFDGIVKLEYSETDISAMFSKEKERLPFPTPLKVKPSDAVEVWLKKVQETMKSTLIKSLISGQKSYGEGENRKNWVLTNYGQIVATICQVMWCQDTENALSLMAAGEKIALQEFKQSQDNQLTELTTLVCGELSELQRCVIVSLITTDVHARDIVEQLRQQNVSSVYDFKWVQQLRYYFEEGSESDSANHIPIAVKQIQSYIKYGLEYMGATSRLVITPLTDRCWITITGALHIKLGANPAGPAGTGKTESTKDLAKAIATLCIVFNCSDQVDYILMGRLFMGLAQQGAWTCLDEFNRIQTEVLSVIAQQLLCIRNALLRLSAETNAPKKEAIGGEEASIFTFVFEDEEIPLRPEFGCHVTMNPGYAGRTELPDNLKVLFRPVAMMIPDYGLIAEIMLYAEGFASASLLAKKMVKLYSLSSEQLSKQDHYDFGMRAVKSVLVMAGALKRSNPQLLEDAVLIRAMKESNVPKFLRDDLPLFHAIVQDLFPTVEIQEPDHGPLMEQIRRSLRSTTFGLQNDILAYNLKILQLFETFNVRFGVMLVGPTGGGKTTCYKILAHTMTALYAAERSKGDKANKLYQHVTTQIINPKSISMGELYGEVDLVSQEWSDGLASKFMRADAGDESEEKRWTIFDGPVDALWIENMNTVLDDNMTLCLSNGQRIKLRPQMRMLFEVQDLAVASPATVSRCGMVYLTPEELGWRPYVKSWIRRFFTDDTVLTQELQDYMWDTLEATVDVALDKIRTHYTEPLKSDNLQQVKSLCKLMEVFLKPERGFKGDDKVKKRDLDYILSFCFTWGLGGSLDERSKDFFDTLVKDLFKAVNYPNVGTQCSVFDFFYDLKKDKTFKTWQSKVEPFVYSKEKSYFELIVPTAETFKYGTFLQDLLGVGQHVFFTGATGVGKSAIIQSTLNTMAVDTHCGNINFSAQTSSKMTQISIEEKISKLNRNTFGPPPGKKRVAIFVDDINMPTTEEYGAQPPIELLRFFVDQQGMYDRKDWSWKIVKDSCLIGCAAPPGGGRQNITPRLTTHFNLFCLPDANNATLSHIFGSILMGFLKAGFQKDIQDNADALIQSTIDVYEKIKEELRPTPAKFHYLFNLRDVSKVIQGICMTKPISVQKSEDLQKLWTHEVSRVFFDRLINESDRDWFIDYVLECLGRSFRSQLTRDDLFGERKVMWGDLLKLDSTLLYEEIKKPENLLKQLRVFLDDYNTSSSNRMNLVFFEDAVLHILRICRALRQPRGNLMCIGVGGSGKQSLLKLSSYMYTMSFKQIEITKGFNSNNFKDFLKERMFESGIGGEKITFCLTDSQILQESFLEFINNLLNTGEIPNLMEAEDKDKITNEVRPIVIAEKKLEDRPDNIYATFVQRVRDFLHITLCMSPVGDDLRVRCRQFPSLVNCCTLDWFSRWPEEALLYVSSEFLKDLELPSQAVRDSLSQMCMMIHTSVENYSNKFYQELRRNVYTTPKSYLDLISLYLSQLAKKRDEYSLNKNRLAGGLSKLNKTNSNIAELKVELKEMQPVLLETKEVLKVKKEKADIEKEKTDEQEAVVQREAEVVGEIAADAEALEKEAEGELAIAQPELDKAQKAVQDLDKNHITELKTFNNPDKSIEKVLEAVMILQGEKPGWDNARRKMGDAGAFLKKLKDFNVDSVADSVFTKVRSKYLKQADFTKEFVQGKSVAAAGMCAWVIALCNFQIIYKKIVPKKEKLKEAKARKNAAESQLNAKRAQLDEVKAKVQKLEDECTLLNNQEADLIAKIDRSQKQMARAEKLVVLLADEGIRWKDTVQSISADIERLVGNVFISCACISYFGAFTGNYRKQLTEGWVKTCIERGIPISEDFSLIKIMGDPVEIRGWGICGLPTDQTSVENGILATKAERWALCIDPQQQANKYLKNLLGKGEQELKILTFGMKNLLRDIEGSVKNGCPVLIEDLEEYIDPVIDPLLLKQEFFVDGFKQIKLGEKTVDYDDLFSLFMTTKLANPHYQPEVCIKVTLINFTVTTEGLEEQLLVDVVKKEKPRVQEKSDFIIVQMDKDQRTLKNIENKILQLLADSSVEQILDEDNLILILESSKITSSEINARMIDAKITEKEVNQTREEYTEVAIIGVILYFVIADMALVNDMYQNSLQFVKVLFNKAIDSTTQSETLEGRLLNLIRQITEVIYNNISRGLFGKDKLIFSFLIATSISRQKKLISQTQWNIFLRGTLPVTPQQANEKPENPVPAVLTEMNFDLLYSVQCNVPTFEGIIKSLKEDRGDWERWGELDNPQDEALPGEWGTKLTEFERILVLKAFRPEKLLYANVNYVRNIMGKEFTEAPSTSMESIYRDMDEKTPLIFILSTGADPTQQLQKFAQDRDMFDKLQQLSLGQGQGIKADKMITQALEKGEWVMLQNCHLCQSWMEDLEKRVLSFADLAEEEIHKDFRLFLTSMPAPFFPVSVLQNGVKLTTEPPRGLKANMKRTFGGFTDDFLNDCKKPDVWRKLLFGLSFFHACVQERRKFGPLGWNKTYEFNDSDLDTSYVMLRLFLNDQEEIPWDALVFVTGHINYGGRVTDDWDRRCLLVTLQQYYCERTVDDPSYLFSDSGSYYAPQFGDINVYRQYIDTLPVLDNPEVFGLHDNANITYQQQETDNMMETVLDIQPRISGGAGGMTPDEVVLLRAKEIFEAIPDNLDRIEGKKELFKTSGALLPSLTTVLLQEMQKFNRLLNRMRDSLQLLEKAIGGFIVMSDELDKMYLSLQNGKVPANWEKVAYPSLKPLASWFQDLKQRVSVIHDWLVNGQPLAFWLSGMFFPQGFMTGCLQTHARQYKIPIDKLRFSFQIMVEEDASEVTEEPEDGVFIYGLYMDGARWNREEAVIDDQMPSQLYSMMPLILFKPVPDYVRDPEEYECPIYKTSKRQGELSTTGQSTNYIIAVDMPTKVKAETWVRRSAAMLCQLND